MVNADGACAVGRFIKARSVLVLPWKNNDAIKKGLNAENHLKVVVQGNNAKIFVNDKEMGAFTGRPPADASLVGLRVTSAAEPLTWAFANFRVESP